MARKPLCSSYAPGAGSRAPGAQLRRRFTGSDRRSARPDSLLGAVTAKLTISTILTTESPKVMLISYHRFMLLMFAG